MLPDLLRPGLDVVFCGTAVADRSADLGHYYAGPGNDFWQLLGESRIVPKRIPLSDDHTVVGLGIGLTDLVKCRSASDDGLLTSEDFDVVGFVEKIETNTPRWVAFHGKTAARAYRRVSGSASQSLGVQTWRVANSEVFVVPSSSGSNRRPTYDGLSSRLEWFQLLRDAVWPIGGFAD
ncbi:mismatch-specific DNA-glycosylase [soil metagenome]